MLGGEGEGRERGRVRVLGRGGRVKKGLYTDQNNVVLTSDASK